jgi:hypothetical protein
VFTVEERNRVRDRMIEMGRADRRVVAAAVIGSSTGGGGDRWSDIDLGFGLAESITVTDVLTDWTSRLEKEFKAVHLFDLPYQSTVYRVFLFPGNLQVDLSFTPGREFGALGPKFSLLFGNAVEGSRPKPASPRHLFGLAVHHLVRARFCIERGRFWQAEYWIGEARNQALSLACLRRGLQTSNGRGFDDLPPEILESFSGSLVGALSRGRLIEALARTVEGLLGNSEDVCNLALGLEPQLRELSFESPLDGQFSNPIH